MDSLGKYLKAERESRNLSLKEVSESVKIKERLLKDIEDDQYKHLPHPVYVKGFLNVYAKYLGLDENDIVLRYQGYQENNNLSKVPESKGQVNSPKWKGRLWPFFVIAIIPFLWGLKFYFSLRPANHFLPSFQKKNHIRSRLTPFSALAFCKNSLEVILGTLPHFGATGENIWYNGEDKKSGSGECP